MKKSVVKGFITLATVIAFAILGIAASHTTAHADTTDNDPSFSTVLSTAKSKLGKPYVWGATGPLSFDCSGFTSYVYKKAANITIPRTAQAQYNAYKHVKGSAVKKGDLVFFGGSTSSISHVGLYIGKGQMIDAQNRGVITESIYAPWWHKVGYAHVTDMNS
ncbi:hydrolase [Secundilactobacillus paracollinoides]|uniref:Hydrolase n=1 Tax=Secundilactobacillus paracollinoides TaxID=240427 RepID=A0A1B2IZ50_9LACO|nr:C40 family peptidase [Secundilactobacillus paracollinoides]ANZ61369.1 hydrolase [Secundilactobacillus paracollinoides]ANZ64237.1 hydrolase [Secundilactobacillus paracollinoides]ANZ67289.1 hydrolase [Secundilactobacillus paracollinoides]KRL78206.1 cell wall-associated hydrolase [Secundilactobacillus paracollinoides DSM 15502 = JCM 11969]